MMTHPLVTQLRFARSEFRRCLEDTPEEDATRRLEPSNCLSWIVGHLASQEQFLWVQMGLGENPYPGLHEIVGWGCPGSVPSWEEMWAVWRGVTRAADRFLDTITDETLDQYLTWQGETSREPVGMMLLRNIYHYWFHLGEGHALRQQMGHENLPDFVGNMADVRYKV
jgi:hypothetical protein